MAARCLDKELEEQQNKLVRADKLLRKVKRETRQLKESRIPIQFAEVSQCLADSTYFQLFAANQTTNHKDLLFVMLYHYGYLD